MNLYFPALQGLFVLFEFEGTVYETATECNWRSAVYSHKTWTNEIKKNIYCQVRRYIAVNYLLIKFQIHLK